MSSLYVPRYYSQNSADIIFKVTVYPISDPKAVPIAIQLPPTCTY